MSENIRVGIIGAGGNTTLKHIPLLQKIDGVEIVSVANRSIKSSSEVASQFEIKNYYDNWLSVVDDNSLDAIVIGTWPYLHKRLTIEALEAGKHVLCEARMCMNAEEAQEMLEVSQMYPNLISQIVPAPHTLPIDKTIKRLISSGYIGDLINLRGMVTAGNDFPKENEEFHWRNNRDLSGKKLLKVSEIQEDIIVVEYLIVGKYALQFLWSDAHETGIYPYNSLLGYALNDEAVICSDKNKLLEDLNI